MRRSAVALVLVTALGGCMSAESGPSMTPPGSCSGCYGKAPRPVSLPGVQSAWGEQVPMINPYASAPPTALAANSMMQRDIPLDLVQVGGSAMPGAPSGVVPASYNPGACPPGGCMPNPFAPSGGILAPPGMPFAPGAAPGGGMMPVMGPGGQMMPPGMGQAGGPMTLPPGMGGPMLPGMGGPMMPGGMGPGGPMAGGPGAMLPPGMGQGGAPGQSGQEAGPNPGDLQLTSGMLPPGAVAALGAMTANGQIRFPTQRTQVRFMRPSGMKVGWYTLGPDGKAGYSETGIEAPGRYNFLQGAIYRLKLTHINAAAGLEVYPTLEVVPANPRTEAFLAHSAVPVDFTQEDFKQITGGNYVVKVIYLPNPQFQELASTGPDEIVSTQLEPGADPIAEALRRGDILLIIRMGNLDQGAPNTPPLNAPGGGAAPALPGAAMGMPGMPGAVMGMPGMPGGVMGMPGMPGAAMGMPGMPGMPGAGMGMMGPGAPPPGRMVLEPMPPGAMVGPGRPLMPPPAGMMGPGGPAQPGGPAPAAKQLTPPVAPNLGSVPPPPAPRPGGPVTMVPDLATLQQAAAMGVPIPPELDIRPKNNR